MFNISAVHEPIAKVLVGHNEKTKKNDYPASFNVHMTLNVKLKHP